MKKFLLTFALALAALSAGAQRSYAEYVEEAGSAPFIVVDKTALTLALVDAQGKAIKEYGISVAVNRGPKQVAGDHKTPEGKFRINELLYAKGLKHDFHDGKGPIKDAYGPWFLRPESIGSRATEGCVRMRNADILDLKSRVKLGTVVIILPD